MKTFISKAQKLSQKAAELKAALAQVPPKVAEIREAVAATAGQLQHLRMDVQSTVAALKADNEIRISQALQEINASLEVFLEAGYELGGVDLEISPIQRLMVHLNKLEDLHPSTIRSLITANQHRPITHAILEALLQARQVTDEVKLTHLHCGELIVHVGPVPSVRLCWRAEEDLAPEAVEKPATPSSAPPSLPPQSGFGESSFFERRAPQPATTPIATVETGGGASPARAPVTLSTPTLATTATKHFTPSETKPAALTAAQWSKDTLARFKKMPDLSKYRR